MSGQIKFYLDQIMASKARGEPFTEKLTRTKLLAKGINFDAYSEASEDDVGVLRKVKQAAKDFGVQLKDIDGNIIDIDGNTIDG